MNTCYFGHWQNLRNGDRWYRINSETGKNKKSLTGKIRKRMLIMAPNKTCRKQDGTMNRTRMQKTKKS